MWSDQIERPDWYDGSSLQRGISQYFADAREREAAALRADNLRLGKLLDGLRAAEAMGAHARCLATQ